MYCTNCGNKLDFEARYCTDCGQAVVQTKKIPDPFDPAGSYDVPISKQRQQSLFGLISFLTAIVSIISPFLIAGAIIGGVAVIIGIYAMVKEKVQGFAIAGFVVGLLGVILNLAVYYVDQHTDMFNNLITIINIL